MSYDDWRTSAPTDDLPSVRSEQCAIGGCREPWAWATDDDVCLCERHATEFLAREHHRDEGDDAMAEVRAEREAEWRDAS